MFAATTLLVATLVLTLLISILRRPKPLCDCGPSRVVVTAERLVGTWKAVGSFREEYLVLYQSGKLKIGMANHPSGGGTWEVRGSCLHLEAMMTDAWYKPTYCITLSEDGHHLQLDRPMMTATLVQKD